MTVQEYFEKLRNALNERGVKFTKNKLRGFLSEKNISGYDEVLESVDQDYERMAYFYSEGVNDPERNNVYLNLEKRLYDIIQNVYRKWLIKSNPSFSTAYKAVETLDLTPDKIKAHLENFVSEQAMLSLLPANELDEKKKSLYRQHYDFIKNVFNFILVSPAWTDSEADAYEEMLLSPTTDSMDAQVMITAIMLGLFAVFDSNRFKVLVKVYQKSIDMLVRERALVGWALTAVHDKCDYFDMTADLVAEACKDEKTRKELAELQQQIYYTLEAEKDDDKIQKEIMPDLLKKGNFKINRYGIEETESEEDRLNKILYPDAEEKAMEAMEKSIEKMRNMEKNGSDIYFGGFRQMKRFGFFYQLVNWFTPYYIEHPELERAREKMQGASFLHDILKNGAFCESDKYSFILSFSAVYEKIPAEMKEMLRGGLTSGAVLGFDENKNTAMYVRRHYLQDLYRFYRLYSQKEDFENPFKKDNLDIDTFSTNLENSKIFPALFLSDNKYHIGELAGEKVKVARFLLKHHFVNEALAVLASMDEDSIEIAKLKIMASLASGESDYALSIMNMELLKHSDDQELLRIAGKVSLREGEYELAVMYYKLLLGSSSEDKELQRNYSMALVETGEIEEAFTYLHRLYYEDPNDLIVQRIMAWGFLKNKEFDRSAAMYKSILESSKVTSEDFQNAAYCYWFHGNVKEAVQLFRKSLDAQNEKKKSFTSLLNKEKDLLQDNGIDKVGMQLMIDLVDEK